MLLIYSLFDLRQRLESKSLHFNNSTFAPQNEKQEEHLLSSAPLSV